jgi:hypothetical protein
VQHHLAFLLLRKRFTAEGTENIEFYIFSFVPSVFSVVQTKKHNYGIVQFDAHKIPEYGISDR